MADAAEFVSLGGELTALQQQHITNLQTEAALRTEGANLEAELTAQAQSGKNDDLVMSLAIGLWLYDAERKTVKKKVDMNAAMLAGFAMNKREEPIPHDPLRHQLSVFTSRGMPVIMDESNPMISGSMDFKWLY